MNYTPSFNIYIFASFRCTTTPSVLEVITKTSGTKVYRLDLNGLNPEGSTVRPSSKLNVFFGNLDLVRMALLKGYYGSLFYWRYTD